MLFPVKFNAPRSSEEFEFTITLLGPEAISLNLPVPITCKGCAVAAVPTPKRLFVLSKYKLALEPNEVASFHDVKDGSLKANPAFHPLLGDLPFCISIDVLRAEQSIQASEVWIGLMSVFMCSPVCMTAGSVLVNVFLSCATRTRQIGTYCSAFVLRNNALFDCFPGAGGLIFAKSFFQ